MTTLPNPKALAPPPPAITTDTFTRPASEFDAGINASTAWVAEQADRDAGLSISDDEEETDTGAGRAARALYDFGGKPEFRELAMRAGDALDILKEELDDGWSLANVDGKVGLIPRSYYAVCALHARMASTLRLIRYLSAHIRDVICTLPSLSRALPTQPGELRRLLDTSQLTQIWGGSPSAAAADNR
jgi:SH3 domain